MVIYLKIRKNIMFQNVYELDCFEDEFRQMTKEKLTLNPPFPRYQQWLIRSLTVLEELQKDAIKLAGFEQLTTVDPKIYSIRYPHAPLNPRVLYAYMDEGNIILLAAFKEKNKSDYTRNIKVAQNRLKHI